MGLFECARPDFATVSKFQDQKGHSLLHVKLENRICAIFWPKISLSKLFVLNISAQDMILIRHIKQKDFKGQNVIKATKY